MNLLRMCFSQDVRTVLTIFQKAKVKLKRMITEPVIVNTDKYNIYEGILSGIEGVLYHWVVNHSEKDWTRGSVHIDG